VAQPGILSSQIPKGEDWIPREIADLKRELRELGPSIMHSFQGVVDELAAQQDTLDAQQATLTAQQATLTTTVADLTTAQATLATTVSGLSTAQATLATAVADIAANLASINAVIGQQVAATVWHNDSGATVFAVTTAWATRASVTFTVPAGYTRALIFGVGQASAVNTTGAVDTLYVCVNVNGVGPGFAASQDVAPGGGLGGAASAGAKLLTGLTGGGTFTITTRICSNLAGWAATVSNECNIDATVVFLR